MYSRCPQSLRPQFSLRFLFATTTLVALAVAWCLTFQDLIFWPYVWTVPFAWGTWFAVGSVAAFAAATMSEFRRDRVVGPLDHATLGWLCASVYFMTGILQAFHVMGSFSDTDCREAIRVAFVGSITPPFLATLVLGLILVARESWHWWPTWLLVSAAAIAIVDVAIHYIGLSQLIQFL